MRGATCLLAALAIAGHPAFSQDFSTGSDAKSWNLYAEEPAYFAARVTDLLCEIADDCSNECAAGRQLGLLRAADGVLVYPMKNAQPVFTGAAVELLPFCGEEVEVDGLMIVDPDIGANNVYLIQKVRLQGASEWTTTDRWTEEWAQKNSDVAGDGLWFRRDPRVQADLAENGWFGLGLERDSEILKELFD